MIPSIEECLQYMDKYEMLSHIKVHSMIVAKVAHVIARNLARKGIDISVEKTTVGALMHDIGKTPSLQSGKDHSEIGRQICMDNNNLHEIADIVAEHVRLKHPIPNDVYSEKEIVFYSDKRVNHDQIVGLNDRMAYILERYGRGQQELCKAIAANFAFCTQVEKKLFDRLDFSAEHLALHAKDEDIHRHL